MGIDENSSPVIIEYKRALNENVINQGLFYLDWLLDHRAEFSLLAMKTLGESVAAKIDWDATRLICIAADFTRYDEHAVAQIDRNIELLRYRSFGDDLLLLELVNTVVRAQPAGGGGGGHKAGPAQTVMDQLAKAAPELTNLYHSLEAFLMAMGDVQQNVTKVYVAYRRLKNFACVEVHHQSKKLLVFVKVDPDSVDLEPGFTRDVRKIGHFGTGDLELTLTSPADLERAKPLIIRSYEAN